MASSNVAVQAVSTDLPAMPLTLEGLSVLHQMFRFRWTEWRKVDPFRQEGIASEAAAALAPSEAAGQSAIYSMLGHKGDLMVVHFRDSFDELNEAELQLDRTGLQEFLEPVHSYLSVIELGLYDSSVKLFRQLAERGLAPNSKEWKQEVDETMDRQRGEEKNWYTLPIEERQRQMEEHGMIGRRYAGKVQQIITGSIGFDDWEWGVDLFADDPLVFKKLIYEMRFDEVSAVYALFGQFFVGLRCPVQKLGEWLGGKLPARE